MIEGHSLYGVRDVKTMPPGSSFNSQPELGAAYFFVDRHSRRRQTAMEINQVLLPVACLVLKGRSAPGSGWGRGCIWTGRVTVIDFVSRYFSRTGVRLDGSKVHL